MGRGEKGARTGFERKRENTGRFSHSTARITDGSYTRMLQHFHRSSASAGEWSGVTSAVNVGEIIDNIYSDCCVLRILI